jgi:Kef-type K+ transport system membrane component KefB
VVETFDKVHFKLNTPGMGQNRKIGTTRVGGLVMTAFHMPPRWQNAFCYAVHILGLSAAFGAIFAMPAHAGGEVPTLAADIGASLLGAGALAVIFARIGIPSIAAFILAGVALGPLGLQAINDAGNIEAIAQIGFILLLFVIGLEIDVPRILASGRTLLLAGALQFPATLLFGILVTKLMMWMGFGGLLTEAPLSPLYLGVAISISSSLLVVKLFQEHFQLDTRPGQISLIVLIFQDIWAIIVTLVQPSLDNPDILKILTSFLGIGILIVIAVVLSRLIANRAFSWIAKKPELVLLGAMSWCFAIMAIGNSFDLVTKAMGLDVTLAVGSGMAALIAGATIASSPYSVEIVTKVGLVKDFFVTLFFVGLGMSIPALTSWEVPLLAVLVAALALVARQLVFFPVFYFVGIDQRNAQVSSVQLAQISEFSLVIMFLGLELGHISQEFAAVIILAFVLTAILTTPLFENAYRIHEKLQGPLARLGFKEPEDDGADDEHEVVLGVLGVHRDASSFLAEIERHRPDLLKHTTVVDFNVALHDSLRDLGVHVVYGDISNEEALQHAGIDRAKVVLCPISDDLLRGIDNAALVRLVRHINPDATIIANAIRLSGVEKIKAAGADVVYMPRMEAGKAIFEAFEHATEQNLDLFNAKQQDTFGDPANRKEVMD